MVQKPVYVLLLDASKAFDKIAFNILFNELRDRSLCPKITKLLYYRYTNQECSIRWDSEHSDHFNVSKVLNKEESYLPYCLVVTLINCFHN